MGGLRFSQIPHRCMNQHLAWQKCNHWDTCARGTRPRFFCASIQKSLANLRSFLYNRPAPAPRGQTDRTRRLSSVVEHILHTDGVTSSNLVACIKFPVHHRPPRPPTPRRARFFTCGSPWGCVIGGVQTGVQLVYKKRAGVQNRPPLAACENKINQHYGWNYQA